MVTKRRRLCKTSVIREAGGLNFLSTTCNFFTLGKRCVSVIDVSSCYLPADIEDSPVQSVAVLGRRKILGLKFSLTSPPFSHHMASYWIVG